MKIKFDGKEIEVKSLDLNQLIEVEEKFGSLAKLKSMEEVPLKLVRYIAYQCIHPALPELTEEQIGEKLDFETIRDIMKMMTPEAKVGGERPLEQP